jgi:hypothetical protein
LQRSGTLNWDSFWAEPDVAVTSIVAVVDSNDCRNVRLGLIMSWLIGSWLVGSWMVWRWRIWSGLIWIVRGWSVRFVRVCQKWCWAKMGFAKKRAANGARSKRFSEVRDGLRETRVQEFWGEGQSTGAGQRSVVTKRSWLPAERSVD